MPLPIVYSPFTKLIAPWNGKQGCPCGDFEMDFIRCATRVGSVRANFDCKKELSDFAECMEKTKQFERCKIMEKERKRQRRPPIEPLGMDIPSKNKY